MRAAMPRLRSVFLLTALVLLGLSFALSHSPVEAAEGVVTFSPAGPLVGKPITASLSDADGTVSSLTWQWSASNTPTGTFADITGATSASFTPGVEHDGLYLRATATYDDSAGTGNTAYGVTSARVNVEPPQFTNKTPKAVEVPENTTQVTVLKAKGASTLINYAVDGGADASKFKVVTAVESNALVSRLLFKEAPNYDSPTDVESTSPSNAAGNNEYVVRVRASYAAGLGDSTSRSTTRTIIVTVTDVDAPKQVTALTATPGYHEQKESFTVKAKWTAPDPLPTGRYKVELLQGSNVLQVKRKGSSAIMASFRSLNPGESYKIRVTPHNENEDGVETPGTAVEAAFTALTKIPDTPPGAVTTLKLTPGYSHSAQSYTITVEWTAPNPAPTGPYLVQVVDSTNWTWRKNPGPEATKTVFNAYLKAGAQYTVKVTARNKGDGKTTGGVTFGSVVTGTVTTLSPPAAPGAVTDLKVVIDDPHVIATWKAPSPAPTGQYKITVDQGSGTPVIQEIWKKKGNRAVFSVYDPGKRYRVSVTAHNKNEVSLTAGPTTRVTSPPPPTRPGLVVGVKMVPTSNSMVVTWGEPSTGKPTGNYLIEFFEGSGTTPIESFMRKARKALFTGLKANTNYRVRVTAHNKNDGGVTAGPSRQQNGTTLAASAGGLPRAPSNISCSASNKTATTYTLDLSWTAAPANGSELKRYFILVTELDSDGNQVEPQFVERDRREEQEDGSATSFSYSRPLKLGTTYRVDIRAKNGAGLGPRAEKECKIDS